MKSTAIFRNLPNGKFADGAFSYIIGSEVTHTDNVPDDMVSREILEANYAVFTARGTMPDSIQNMIKYIYQEWLPKSKYQHAHSPEFELYDERSDDSENAEVDIYIPIMSS
jgi:AraC family transcriptional regulator